MHGFECTVFHLVCSRYFNIVTNDDVWYTYIEKEGEYISKTSTFEHVVVL